MLGWKEWSETFKVDVQIACALLYGVVPLLNDSKIQKQLEKLFISAVKP